MIIAGLDEAGRGPVIGPLVLAGVSVNEDKIKELKRIGVKDSKLLSPGQREELFDKIKEVINDYRIIIVEPWEIDEFVKDNRLNELELLKFCEIINYLMPDKAIIDAPGNNKGVMLDFIKNHLLKKNIRVILEHKADLKYEVVGAASILAKVTRDLEIERLKKEYNIDFGSGYPSDEITKDFLRKNWNTEKYKKLYRKSWDSWKRLKEEEERKREERSQKKLSDYE